MTGSVLAGRHKNDPTRRPIGTGLADAGKDRAAHQERRGKKMTPDTLVSEMLSDEDLKSIKRFVELESDRGAVIMCSALVEQSLELSLRVRLSHLTHTELYQWFKDSNAPFKSFEAKIKLARGIEICDDSAEEKMNIIRKIRNIFAHRSMPIDFNHPGLTSLQSPLLDRFADYPLPKKLLFAAYCLSITALLRGLDPDSFLGD